MAKKPQVDVRKLKDEVAELLKKSRWEKAAETLEQLVAAEPKDMAHRLRLGDTYRRLGQPDKAIGNYQHAAAFFADLGQLIKAIGAVKIILELDPRNAEAQKQLQEMNERRFGKVTMESAGLKTAMPSAAARSAAPIELPEPDEEMGGETSPGLEAAPDDEPLELDDGAPPPKRVAASAAGPLLPQRGFQARATPPPSARGRSLDAAANAIVPPPPRESQGLTFDPDDGPAEQLPDDAILAPEAEDLEVSEIEEVDADDEILPAAAPPPSIPLPPRKLASVSRPAVTISEQIDIEEETPAPRGRASARAVRGAQPIADLLSSGPEEEVELLSITSGEEAAPQSPAGAPQAPGEDDDLEAALGNIAPRRGAQAKRVPTGKVPLFDDLSQDAFVELVNRVEYHRHLAGQLIIREGDPGRSFYVIVEGKVRIYKMAPDGKEITLAHLREGAFFGEMALLSGAPRTANVAAEEDTEILEVTDVVLRDLAGKYPQVISSLKNFYRQRLLNNVMAISPLFRDFGPAERKAIVEKFRMKQAAPSQVLITEGANSDGLYVVLHGAVQVTVSRDGRPVELARLKEGEIFGEMSLLTRRPATATVTSQGNSILLRLPRENFQELVLTHPQILELVSELTERRKSATEAILQGQGEGHDGMSFV